MSFTKMDRNGLFCCASTTLKTEGQIVASVTLPYPLDLTKDDYELGLTYLSLVPTWLNVPDLWCLHTDQKEEEDYLKLGRVSHAEKEETLQALSLQLLSEYGPNMKSARIKLLKDKSTNMVWTLRLQSKSELVLSPGLALMLGIPQSIENETDKVKDFTVSYKSYETFLENSLYYLSCHQGVPNFVNCQGKRSSFLDFIHIPNAKRASTIERTFVNINYVKLDGSLLHKISFGLYNHAALPMTSLHTDLILLFHIRKINYAQ